MCQRNGSVKLDSFVQERRAAVAWEFQAHRHYLGVLQGVLHGQSEQSAVASGGVVSFEARSRFISYPSIVEAT